MWPSLAGMFFIPVPPGKLIWDCEALVNSVVMKYSMRKPQGQSSLYAPPPPSASELSGNRLLQIPQEGVKPLVGTVGFRTGVSSLWPVPLSFNELMPISKDSRTFPGGSQGTCPPSSETLLSPTAQGVMLSTPSRELLVDRGDTPSLRLGVL